MKNNKTTKAIEIKPRIQDSSLADDGKGCLFLIFMFALFAAPVYLAYTFGLAGFIGGAIMFLFVLFLMGWK